MDDTKKSGLLDGGFECCLSTVAVGCSVEVRKMESERIPTGRRIKVEEEGGSEACSVQRMMRELVTWSSGSLLAKN